MKKSFLITIMILLTAVFLLAGCDHPETPASSSSQAPSPAPAPAPSPAPDPAPAPAPDPDTDPDPDPNPSTQTMPRHTTPVRVEAHQLISYIDNLEGTTYNNPALIEIYFDENETSFSAPNAYSIYTQNKYYEFFFAEGITRLEWEMYFFTGLRAIHIPSTLTLFRFPFITGCPNLTTLYLPDTSDWWISSNETDTTGTTVTISSTQVTQLSLVYNDKWWHHGPQMGTATTDPTPNNPGNSTVTPAVPVNP